MEHFKPPDPFENRIHAEALMRVLFPPLAALVVLVTAAAVQWAYHAPRLPDRVAVHMNASGDVDRWAEKPAALAEAATGWLTVGAILLAASAASVLGVRYLPATIVNVPRKDYWLATPERRVQVATVMAAFHLWLLAVMVGFGIALTETIVRSSDTGHDPGYTLPLVVGLVVAVLAMIAWLIVRFSRPPVDDVKGI